MKSLTQGIMLNVDSIKQTCTKMFVNKYIIILFILRLRPMTSSQQQHMATASRRRMIQIWYG